MVPGGKEGCESTALEKDERTMTTPRVVSLTYDFYPYDIRVRRLAEAAIAGGYAAEVICLREPGEPAREQVDGVRIYRLPLGRGYGRSLPVTVVCWCWFAVMAGTLLLWLHLRRRYAVVIAHNMPDFLVCAALPVRFLGARVLLDIQDTSPELMAAKAHGYKRVILRCLAALQERLSVACADAVMTVGWPFEEVLVARGIPRAKVCSIINSADPRLFPAVRRDQPSRAREQRNGLTLMYYGTVAQRNGLDIAMRAFALAHREVPGLRFAIMGRGEALPEVERLAGELGVADNVTFVPNCPSERIVDFVVAGDIGIVPYRSDGFADLVLPTKMYEMAWMRRPIIAADTPAIRSLFGTEAVLLCAPEQPEQFAKAIVHLAGDPALRDRLVTLAAEAYQPYRWEMMSKQYQALLARLASSSSADRVPGRAAPQA